MRNEASMNVGIHSLYEEEDSVMNPKLGTEVCFSAADADFWGWTRQAFLLLGHKPQLGTSKPPTFTERDKEQQTQKRGILPKL